MDYKDDSILSEISRIAEEEAKLKKKPSKKEYKDAKKVFKDFNIDIEIPEFANRLELQRFIKTTISKHLENF